MITFFLCLIALISGYLFYGKFIDRFFGSSAEQPVPAIEKADGVDYKVIPTWKLFVIQFLNIAGLGPIFGVILGAAYGPAAFVWIVLGCIFMGSVHDFFAGMLSLRNGGVNMQELAARYLGPVMKVLMSILLMFLLLAVGVSFITGPADLLTSLTSLDKVWWLVIIFCYYILATLLPIDKIIGTIYPYMGAALLFMAFGVGCFMLWHHGIVGDIHMTELTWEGLTTNYHAEPGSHILLPMMFIAISCGAISGFHSTQAPLVARCMKSEKDGRRLFYGAMIAEGIVAMVWASAAISFYGGTEGLNAAAGEGVTPAIAVNAICNTWLGKIGAVIAIIGVVVCPITSGDTAFRSLRLTIADLTKLSQKPIIQRLIVALPIFIVAYFLCEMEFKTVWNYVGISNQLLATFVLWTATAYLIREGKPHWFTSLPATFLTFIVVSYFFLAPHKDGGLFLTPAIGYTAGIVAAAACFLFAIAKARNHKKNSLYDRKK